MTVGEMEQRMSQQEYLHWVAYYNIRTMRQEISNRRAR